MTRLNIVARETAEPTTAKLIDGVEKKLGILPNLISTMAQSTAVANAYLGFSNALSGGSLPAQVREQIALTVGEANGCNYCVAAHSAIGAGAGLDESSLLNARRGTASDAKTDLILKFANTIVKTQGKVSDDDVDQLKLAGLSDGEIGEVVANVALNIFTNYFNHVAETEIDFPIPAKLEDPSAASCSS